MSGCKSDADGMSQRLTSFEVRSRPPVWGNLCVGRKALGAWIFVSEFLVATVNSVFDSIALPDWQGVAGHFWKL